MAIRDYHMPDQGFIPEEVSPLGHNYPVGMDPDDIRWIRDINRREEQVESLMRELLDVRR